jgi:hypothetical protein
MLVRRISGLLLAAALTAAVAASPAAAGKPGGRTASGPTLSGPATAQVGETYTVTGSGFAAGSLVPLEIAEADGCCIALNLVADSFGTFSYSGEVWAPGTYRVRALVPRNGGRWRVAASWYFEAYP